MKKISLILAAAFCAALLMTGCANNAQAPVPTAPPETQTAAPGVTDAVDVGTTPDATSTVSPTAAPEATASGITNIPGAADEPSAAPTTNS